MTETYTRTFTLDRAKAKGDTFPAVATTETPVKRSFGFEVLDMSRMDLSRAPLPVIESHDQSKLNIGVFEDMHVDGDKLRGSIRLGKSARAKEVAEDIRAGIVRSVSVGYEAYDPIESGEHDGIPVYRFAAQIHELSLVAAPADINAGIYRSKGTITMDNLNPRTNTRDDEESKRISSIDALAEKYDLVDMGIRAVAAGDSVIEFNANALKAIDERNKKARNQSYSSDPGERSHAPNHYAGMPCDNSKYGQAMEEYSVLKVLRGISDPRQLQEAGLEMEISQDMQTVLGKRSKGVMVPYEALQSRAVTYGGTGSNLVATDHLAGSFIDVLRNRSMVMSLNPTVLRGLVGDVAIPKKTSGASAYWIAGDNADAITESDLVLSQLTLAPNTVGGAVTFSHKMIIQSSPDIETMVRGDLADLIASEIDLKAINGTGASNQPTGILATSGIGALDLAADDPTYAELVAVETTIANANADQGRLAWLMDPTMAAALKSTGKQGSGVEGNFIWENGADGDGRVLGLPAYRTKNMPDGYLLLGNWQHLMVGFWGGIEIDVDPYGSNFLKGSITVRVLADVDMGVRHPGAFCEAHNAA